MGYSSQEYETFTYFTDTEASLIERWLKKHGYTWSSPTLCGNCCGMFTDAYWVNGIGGGWRNDQDFEEFDKFVQKNDIKAKYDRDDYHIEAIDAQFAMVCSAEWSLYDPYIEHLTGVGPKKYSQTILFGTLPLDIEPANVAQQPHFHGQTIGTKQLSSEQHDTTKRPSFPQAASTSTTQPVK